MDQNCLSDRYITVRFKDVLLKRRRLLARVPQGLVLSPLLFIIYTLGLKSNLRNETLLCIYADDITLQCTRRNARNMLKSLNQDLKDFKNWADEVKLELNSSKRSKQYILE